MLYSKFPYALGLFAELSIVLDWIGWLFVHQYQPHFSNRMFKMCVCVSHSIMANSLWPHGLTAYQALVCPWDSPGKNTAVGSHVLLQGIFLNQGSSPRLLHYRWIRYHLSHQGSPTTVFYNWWHHGHTALLFQNFPHYSCILLFIYKNSKINKLIFWKIFQVKIWCQAFFVFVFVLFFLHLHLSVY